MGPHEATTNVVAFVTQAEVTDVLVTTFGGLVEAFV
jgi:hypothetical protein